MTKPELSPCLNFEIINGGVRCTLPKECADENCPNKYARRNHSRTPSLTCLYVWKGKEAPIKPQTSTPVQTRDSCAPSKASPDVTKPMEILDDLNILIHTVNSYVFGVFPIRSDIPKEEIKFFIQQWKMKVKEEMRRV